MPQSSNQQSQMYQSSELKFWMLIATFEGDGLREQRVVPTVR